MAKLILILTPFTQIYGFRCDSVDDVISAWDDSFRVTCNDYRYAYSIEDIGGNWIVKVE